MVAYLLKGILIGLLFGLPVGAIGAMTVQRTWSFGIKAGLLTGLGSSVADCLYAVVGAFGLTFISTFLLQYQTVINVAGSALVLFMGVRLILKKENTVVEQTGLIGSTKMFFSSFAVGITNPAAILTFLFAFSYFGISHINEWMGGGLLVCGVFIGTYIWWGSLSVLTAAVKKKMKQDRFRYMNKVFGAILILLGVTLFLRVVT